MSTDANNKDLQASVSTSEIEVSLTNTKTTVEDEEALLQEAHEVIANAIVKNELGKIASTND